MKKILLTFLLISFFSSCKNDELSKEMAMQIIKKNFNKNCERGILNGGISYSNNYEKIKKSLLKAERQGYVTVEVVTLKQFQKVKAKPTQETTSKYGVGNGFYIIAVPEILEIIGISQNSENNTATVRFSYQYVPTPLYNIKRKLYNSKECSKGTITEEVKFIKFDTGWRIQ